MTERILLSELIDRYPGRYTVDNVPDRERRPPPAPPQARRAEGDAPTDPAPHEDPGRPVVSKVTVWAETVPPGCQTATQVLQVSKGQVLPLSEALALGIDYQEQDGPHTFQVELKDGTPTVVVPEPPVTRPEDPTEVDAVWDAIPGPDTEA